MHITRQKSELPANLVTNMYKKRNIITFLHVNVLLVKRFVINVLRRAYLRVAVSKVAEGWSWFSKNV